MSNLPSSFINVQLAEKPIPIADKDIYQELQDLHAAIHALNSAIGGNLVLNLPKYTTAGRPPAVDGGMIFDTTLNKACVGTPTGWQAITSV